MTSILELSKLPQETAKWKATTAGPIQIKRVNDAIRAAKRAGESSRTIYDSGAMITWSPGTPCHPDIEKELTELGERFQWTVTKENASVIMSFCQLVEKKAHELMHIEDRRTTPEQRAQQEEARKRMEKEQAERDFERKQRSDKLLAKKPGWAYCAIIAEEVEDESDCTTDYHGHKTLRRVLIGWRRGKREDFHQLRTAAGRYEPTKHLGVGKDVWTVRVWTEPKPANENSFRPSRSFYAKNGTRWWSTEEEARAAITAAGESEAPYGYELQRESVEHRENYSMGAGNYLSAGGRDSSGWKVKSADLSELHEFEDGLPDVPVAEPGETVSTMGSHPRWVCVRAGRESEAMGHEDIRTK